MKKSTSKFILKTMILITLIFSSIIFVYQNIITYIEENRDKTIEYLKEEQFSIIWEYINYFKDQARDEVTEISKNIEKDILNLSDSEFLKIQEDMSNGIHNDILHNIIINNTDYHSLNNINNHCNGIIILTNDGYMEDYNYRRAKDNNNEERSLVRKWDDDIKNSYNPELEKNAIDKIIKRTSGIIALESYDLINDKNHIKIKELTYDTLLEVYIKEGINGFRNYQIYVPYYITDIGDIFGVPDISEGVTVENNKIIIVQEFNIFDQLKAVNKDDTSITNKKINNIIDTNNSILRLLYIFGILIATAVGLLVLWTSSYYNMILDHECNNKKNE